MCKYLLCLINKTPIDVNARKMYQLTDDGVTVAAYLAIGKETVQVQTVEKTLTFTFPNLSEHKQRVSYC